VKVIADLMQGRPRGVSKVTTHALQEGRDTFASRLTDLPLLGIGFEGSGTNGVRHRDVL